MAGVLGNLYDRLGFPGLRWNEARDLHKIGEPVFAVRDWILVMLGTRPWPNFNIADSLLVCGAMLLVWHALFQKEPKDGDPVV
jgi:signal peptidase II